MNINEGTALHFTRAYLPDSELDNFKDKSDSNQVPNYMVLVSTTRPEL